MNAAVGEAVVDKLGPLQKYCQGEPEVMCEGGFLFVYLPGLSFKASGADVVVNGLLCPQHVPCLGGYTTRLLLERPAGSSVAWSTVTVLGRTWYTWSWNNVLAEWPWDQILANHLKALA